MAHNPAQHESLHQYLARISPPPITPTKLPKRTNCTRTHMSSTLFYSRTSQTKKRAAFSFRKNLCILTSAVDTRVVRPRRRPASKSRLSVEDESRHFWAGGWMGGYISTKGGKTLPMINARANTIGGRRCPQPGDVLIVHRHLVKQRWEDHSRKSEIAKVDEL